MKIQRITYKDYHDPIYGSLDKHPYVRGKLADPPDFMKAMIGYNRSSAFMTNLGLRVAAISSRYLEILTAYEESESFVAELENFGMENILSRMKSCYPGGAEVDLSNRFYCKKYAVCPWCRFRKAVKIGKALGSHLKKSGGLAVIKISQPDVFDGQFDNPKEAYSRLIRGICVTKKPKLFLCDAVITVPNWYQSYLHEYSQHARDKEWVFSKDTTIIGILPKDVGALPLPEEMVSPKARESMGFCGASSWRIYKPTTQNLRYALGYAMRVSPGLLSASIDPVRYVECIDMQANYREAYHGLSGITPSDS